MKCRLDIKKDFNHTILKGVSQAPFKHFNVDEGTITYKIEKGATTDVVNADRDYINNTINSSVNGGICNVKMVGGEIVLKLEPSERIIDTYLEYLRKSSNESIRNKVKDSSIDYKESLLGIASNNLEEDFEEEYLADDFSPSIMSGANPLTMVGTYEKTIQFLKNKKAAFSERLSRVKAAKRAEKDPKKLLELEKVEKYLQGELFGHDENSITISDRIKQLETFPVASAISSYITEELNSIKALIEQGSEEDLEQASEIINYITQCADFTYDEENNLFIATKNNPLFSEGETLLEDAIQPLRYWAELARGEDKRVADKKEEIIVRRVNSLGLRGTKDKKFTIDDIVPEQGMKDIYLFDSWFLDITRKISKEDSILPTAAREVLDSIYDSKMKWRNDVSERLARIQPQVEAILKRKGYGITGLNILGIGGVNWDLFMQKKENGDNTLRLTDKYSDKFYTDRAAMRIIFQNIISNAKMFADPKLRASEVARAMNLKRMWYLENTIMLDINKLSAFHSMPELAGLVDPSTADKSYEDMIKSIVGERHFNKIIEDQKEQIKRYVRAEKLQIEALKTSGHVDPQTGDLNEEGKQALELYRLKNSPLSGIKDFNSVKGERDLFNNRISNNFNYNVTIPRKNKAEVTADGDNYVVTEKKDKATGFYDKKYEEIEQEPILLEALSILKEIFEVSEEVLPEYMKGKEASGLVPFLKRSIIEILFDNRLTGIEKIVTILKNIWDDIRKGASSSIDSEIFRAIVDPLTNKPVYKVNDGFLKANMTRISRDVKMLEMEFLARYNALRPNARLNKISSKSGLSIDVISKNPNLIPLISEVLGVKASLEDIKRALGDNKVFQIKRAIKERVIDNIAKEQTLDLPKIARFYATAAMQYSARNEALPIINLMREYYQNIKKIDRGNVGAAFVNRLNNLTVDFGNRSLANKRFEYWYQSKVLGNATENPQIKNNGVEERRKNLKGILASLTGNVFTKKFYTFEDREMLDEIERLKKLDLSEEDIAYLDGIKNNLGRVTSFQRMLESMLSFTRLKELGWALKSAFTNLAEGFMSNMIIAANGDYFPPHLFNQAMSIVMANFMMPNNLSSEYNTKVSKKVRALMRNYNILQDSSNEFDKSLIKTNFSRLNVLKPFTLTRKVEFINQSPLMIAMLMNEKVTSEDGKSTISVWEAMEHNGKLKKGYRTRENISNWEKKEGPKYKEFKHTITTLINDAHGNYHHLGGMMIKGSAVGKAFMMFLTWMPNYIANLVKEEQFDYSTGKRVKGRFRSHTRTSAIAQILVANSAFLGPVGLAIGAGAAWTAASFYGTSSKVGPLRQAIDITKNLARKMVGVPLNLGAAMLGKSTIIDTSKDFNNWIGSDFTELDAKNMRSNITAMMVTLTINMITLLSLAAYKSYDDDDEDNEDQWWQMGTLRLLINRNAILLDQINMWTSPSSMYRSFIAQKPLIRTLENIAKFADDLDNFYLYGTLSNKVGEQGEPKVFNSAVKALVPNTFQDNMLGLKGSMENFYPTANSLIYKKAFRSYEQKLDHEITNSRLRLRKNLRDSGLTEEEIDKAMRKIRRKRKQSKEAYLESLENMNKEKER